MKHPLSFLGGCIAGVMAMYYLDQRNGARRRAMVRDKLVAAGHDVADYAQAKGKRIADQAHGVMATGSLHRTTRRPPESDAQLRERIRAQLGHLLSHPRLVDVQVDNGCVCLTGHALRSELDRVKTELRGMAGVCEVESRLEAHERPEELQNIPAHAAAGATAGTPA